MADSITVNVSGLRELGERMKKLDAAMTKKIARSAVGAGASIVAKAAKQKAPVDTGNLRKNIVSRRLKPAETALTSEFRVTVRTGKLTQKQRATGLADAYYARFLEYGTVHMAARPFLRPAFDENKERAMQAMKDRIAERLDKVDA